MSFLIDEWKPEETAPKDRPFLAFNRGGFQVVDYGKRQVVQAGFRDALTWEPTVFTHWMPLPPQPSE